MKKIDSPPIMPARLDWPSTLGLFLLNFGTLDYSIMAYLRDHLEAQEYEQVRNWHLKDRLSRISKHLSDNGCPAAEFESLSATLDPIRELRNHIAHGHMSCRWITETETWEVSVAAAKNIDEQYSPNARHLTFDELKNSLNELTTLIEAFKKFVGFKPGWGREWTPKE